MADTLLDIIDETNEVVGQALRSEIHAKGLLHREIHIWFITPDKKVIFQKRSMKKDTYPGFLTIAVGGHVEGGSTHEETVLIEAAEETGLDIKISDLKFLGIRRANVSDAVTNTKNNALQKLYGYLFTGKLDDLKVELDESEGYFLVDWNDIINLETDLFKQTEPGLLTDEFNIIRDKLESMVK